MRMPDRLSVAFQGTKSGLIIAIDETLAEESLLAALRQKLETSGYFFVDAEVVLSLGDREISRKRLEAIRETVEAQHGLRITGVKTASRQTAAVARELGLAPTIVSTGGGTGLEENGQSGSKPGKSCDRRNSLSVELIRRTLRSGQIHESAGHVVILGDVNPGAEVVARGDIIVFGKLRGIAHAGATGERRSIIAALKLEPTQLRIANRLARGSDKLAGEYGPEFAHIENDQIIIEKWRNSGQR